MGRLDHNHGEETKGGVLVKYAVKLIIGNRFRWIRGIEAHDRQDALLRALYRLEERNQRVGYDHWMAARQYKDEFRLICGKCGREFTETVYWLSLAQWFAPCPSCEYEGPHEPDDYVKNAWKRDLWRLS